MCQGCHYYGKDRKRIEGIRKTYGLYRQEDAMYIFELCKKLFRKSNLLAFIYVLLNIAVGGLFLTGAVWLAAVILHRDMPFWKVLGLASCVSAGVYILCLLLNLSPLGELILRRKCKCRKLKNKDQINYLNLLYREVLERARLVDPALKDKVRIYVTEAQEAAVFAIGRKTLVVSSGIFGFPPEKSKALMARELGHISQKDSDFILLATTGNGAVIFCIWLVRLLIYSLLILVIALGLVAMLLGMIIGMIIALFPSSEQGTFSRILTGIGSAVTWTTKKVIAFGNWVGRVLAKAWSGLGLAMVLYSRGRSEYEADEFAYHCGYGKTLCSVIINDDPTKQSVDFFKDLVKAYPAKDARLARLWALEETNSGHG